MGRDATCTRSRRSPASSGSAPGCSIEPEVDLSGYWVDGDVLRVGEVRVGRRARIGARSMLCPGSGVGDDAEVAPGSAVFGTVPEGEFWSGAPASRVSGAARGPWSKRPASSRLGRGVRRHCGLLSLLPVVAITAARCRWPCGADVEHRPASPT